MGLHALCVGLSVVLCAIGLLIMFLLLVRLALLVIEMGAVNI